MSVFDKQDNEFLDGLQTVSENCKICKLYRKTPPRPVVGNLFNPDKMKFNNMVSFDLMKRSGRWILYMIDMVTEYTQAKYVKNKKKETIVEKIIVAWIVQRVWTSIRIILL